MPFRSYSPDEYRTAGIGAGPFALEGNPDPEKRNYRVVRKIPIGFGVCHITAGLTDYVLPDASAEGTTKYGMDLARDASWHVCVDSDSIIPSIRDSYVAWHAGVTGHPGINDASLGMEIGTGTTDWRLKPRTWVESTIRRAAVWWAPRVIAHKIPLRLVTLAQCDAYIEAAFAGKLPSAIGFISHATIAPANRTDPGMVNGVDTFPWALLFQYIREEIALLEATTTPTPAPTPIGDLTMTDVTDIMSKLEELATAVGKVPNATKSAIVWYAPKDKAGNATGPALYTALVGAEAKATQILAAVDPDALAAAVVAKLPPGSLDAELVRGAVRDVLGSLNDPIAQPAQGD